MSSTDIVGVVGTWLAVGLATFALLGVVGPLLVWRASKSARNQALAKLDKGLSTSHGFVTKGIRFGPATYLFRRIRAPILTDTLRPPPEWKLNYTHTSLPSQESAGWVQLGAILRNCGMEYPRGDALILKHKSMRLPISTAWLFVFGLVGRFGSRSDTGEWNEEPITCNDVVFEPALPGQGLGRRVRGQVTRASRGWETVDSPPKTDHLWATHPANTRRHDGNLRGLTGRMRCYSRQGHGTVNFVAHKQSCIGGLSEDVLDVATLFWLSIGCLPLAGGRVFYLGDVQYPTRPQHSEPVTEQPQYRDVAPSDPFRGHSDDNNDLVMFDSHDMSQVPVLYQSYSPRPSVEDLPHFYEPRFWSSMVIEDRLLDFVEIADALKAEQNIIKLSLTDMAVASDDTAALREDAERTFIPCHRPWVRLGPPVPKESPFSAFFLDRTSAQLLARAMLQLPICSQGYLIHNPPGSASRDMLVEACNLLPRTLYFLIVHFDLIKPLIPHWELDDTILPNLVKLFRMTSDYSYSRNFASALYDLDNALIETVNRDPDVHLFVQVLTVTSPEFRSLISQSLRDPEACLPGKITFDAETATIAIGTVMGAVKRLPIDLDVLLDNPQRFVRSEVTELRYVEVLLLLLKACLRSTFLKTSLDSTPLFDDVLRSGDFFEAC
jgi:hypothetical protein